MGTRTDPPPGGGQNRVSKNLIMEPFAAKFFSSLRGSKRDSVNLTFNAFLHRNLLFRYIMVPGDHEGVV